MRLNSERQNKIEPIRIEYAKNEITKLGYEIIYEDKTELRFRFKDAVVYFFPYSGWFSGKTIKADRGIKKLLNQIKP